MRVYARYDMEDEKGDSRRQRNTRVGVESPDFEIPESGIYLWDWFKALNESVFRNVDGYYHLIPPSEYKAWSELTGSLITPDEYDILRSMDVVFCNELNADIEAKRIRKTEEQKRTYKKR